MRWTALFATCLLALGVGCAAHTTLSGVWNATDVVPTPLSNVMVLGIGTQETSRRIFEDHFAQALQERGTDAIASYRVLPMDEKLSEPALERAIEAGAHQALVLTRLVAVDEKETYVPPTSSMSMGMGRGYYGYYGSSWGMNYSPGYVQRTTIVRLETRVYSADGDQLVWSAHSETFQPADVDDTVASVTKAVVKRLAEDGWIR